jgi:D-alanine-D-alanine ligase
MKKYDVAVLFGGISNENEISIITGTMVCNLLKNGGKSVLPIFIAVDGKMYAGDGLSNLDVYKADNYSQFFTVTICDGGVALFKQNGRFKGRVEVDCALNCCHGGLGEGGGASGLFLLNNIPIASAGIFESSAFMDKYLTKLVLKSLGVNALPYTYFDSVTTAYSVANSINYPAIVKPCKLGSSIGISKVCNATEFTQAIDTAFQLDNGVIVEQYVDDKREINCAVYMADDKVVVSPCEEAVSCGDIYSYDEKYSGNARAVFPADIPQEVAEVINETTAFVYEKLNMRGIVRFDYILSGDEIFLSEINTVPGSLSYYLLSQSFDDFFKVLCKVIEQGKRDYQKMTKKLVIRTGIINNFKSNACKIK